MKRKELQDIEFKKLMNGTSEEEIEYTRWVAKIYKEYKKELQNRSIFTKILVTIFGDPDLLGYDIVKTYGKNNLENLKDPDLI